MAFTIICFLLQVCSVLANDRPHIVCYVADDFGVADSGCYGHPFVRTPNIDRLAEQGMRFKRAFAGSPTCAPSRSIFYTGLMSARTGAHPNHWPVRTDIKSIGHYLRDAGYHVTVFNKVHVKPEQAFPFERVAAGKKQIGGGGKCIDSEALDAWLSQQLASSDKPLCLFLCDNNTHLVWPDSQHPRINEIELPPYLPNSQVTRESLARYYTEVEMLDARVGECVDVLKKHELYDNSLFVFTADQGPAWLHGKWNLYDLGVQVPLIARWPGKIDPETTSNALVSLVDLTPTFIEVAGGAADSNLDGRSFQASLLDPSHPHRDHIFATHTGDGSMNNYPCRAIRTDRFKLIWNLRSDLEYTTHLTKAAGTDRAAVWKAWMQERESNASVAGPMDAYTKRPEFELYDLVSDPHEINNLADAKPYQSVLVDLQKKLKAWMKAQGDEGHDMQFFLAQRREKS